MAKKILKLYRGLSSDEFNLATADVFKENKKVWSSILENRLNGDFDYPHELDRPITTLHKNLRLEYQYFTDSKVIAEGYARKVGGLLVELSVPLRDVLKHFDIEFQNFGRRKKQFEIVYCVKGSTLAKYGKRWRLKVQRKK
jgi:hypothetical protein